MKNEYLEIKNKYAKFRDKVRKQLANLSEKENEELSKLFDFKDKFVEIKTHHGYIMYLYVEEQFCHSIGPGHPCIMLRGSGFYFEFTEYRDATYAKWDQFCEHDVQIYNLDEEIKNIKEITKEKYNEAFDSMVQQMITKHKNFIFNS